MSVMGKNTIVHGLKMSDSLVTLDKDYNGSFQLKVNIFRHDRAFANNWISIANGEKVSITIDSSGLMLLFVSKVSVKKTYTVQKPQNYENGFYVNDFEQKIFEAANNALQDNKSFCIQLTGASGYGKTSIAEYFSKKYGYKLVTVDCSTITDNQEWFGLSQATNGNTHFELTELSKALIEGNCVILFDEANRVETWISNTLLPILDHRASIRVRNTDIKAAKNIGFFFSTNEGWEYAGTSPLDKALKGRVMGILEVGSLPENVEKYILMDKFKNIDPMIVHIVVNAFNTIRDLDEISVNVSTRTSIYMAYWINYGLTLKEAFQICVLNHAPQDERKILVDVLNKTIAKTEGN